MVMDLLDLLVMGHMIIYFWLIEIVLVGILMYLIR